MPSAEVGILMALMPIATLLLAHWFLEQEPLTWRRFCGVIAGFVASYYWWGRFTGGFDARPVAWANSGADGYFKLRL